MYYKSNNRPSRSSSKKTQHYFAAKAAMTRINENVRNAHPDWSYERVYVVTREIYGDR